MDSDWLYPQIIQNIWGYSQSESADIWGYCQSEACNLGIGRGYTNQKPGNWGLDTPIRSLEFGDWTWMYQSLGIGCTNQKSGI